MTDSNDVYIGVFMALAQQIAHVRMVKVYASNFPCHFFVYLPAALDVGYLFAPELNRSWLAANLSPTGYAIGTDGTPGSQRIASQACETAPDSAFPNFCNYLKVAEGMSIGLCAGWRNPR